METKQCGICKKEFPKTLDYFHKKITKQKRANGEIAIYESFRYSCKDCKRIKEEEKRVKKRCVELDCNVSEYNKYWRKEMSLNKIKYKEISHLPKTLIPSVRKKIDKGYKFTTLDQYKLDCKINMSKGGRKYDYGDVDFIPKKANSSIKHLTDGYVALLLKKRVNELPKDIIETKRLSILIKRELEQLNK